MLTTLQEFTSRIPAGFEAVKFRQRVNIEKAGRITQGAHTREKALRPLELTHYGMEITASVSKMWTEFYTNHQNKQHVMVRMEGF